MTSRAHIEETVRSLYAARCCGDLEGVMKGVADDAVFMLNGRGTGHPAMASAKRSKPAIRSTIKDFIDNFRFDDWKELSLLVDGDKALLHWTAKVTCVPTNKSDQFEVFDLLTFRDGKIVDFRQCTDTALVAAIATP